MLSCCNHEPSHILPGDAGKGRVRPHSAPRIGAAHVNLAWWRTDGAPDWHGIYSLPPAYSGGESAMTSPCFRISGQDGIHPLIMVRSPSSSTHQADPEFVMRISPRSTTAGVGVSRRTASLMPSGPVPQYASTPCCRWDLEGNPDSSREQQQQQQMGARQRPF